VVSALGWGSGVNQESASSPRTVFRFVKQPCWQTARACGESAKHAKARTSGISKYVSRTVDPFIKFLNGKVVIFICAEFRKSLANLARRIGAP
jgi:hypothetical protein